MSTWRHHVLVKQRPGPQLSPDGARLRSVTCTHCGAGVAEICRYPSGGRKGSYCQARWDKANWA